MRRSAHDAGAADPAAARDAAAHDAVVLHRAAARDAAAHDAVVLHRAAARDAAAHDAAVLHRAAARDAAVLHRAIARDAAVLHRAVARDAAACRGGVACASQDATIRDGALHARTDLSPNSQLHRLRRLTDRSPIQIDPHRKRGRQVATNPDDRPRIRSLRRIRSHRSTTGPRHQIRSRNRTYQGALHGASLDASCGGLRDDRGGLRDNRGDLGDDRGDLHERPAGDGDPGAHHAACGAAVPRHAAADAAVPRHAAICVAVPQRVVADAAARRHVVADAVPPQDAVDGPEPRVGEPRRDVVCRRERRGGARQDAVRDAAPAVRAVCFRNSQTF